MRGEEGDTLLELLISIVIISIAASAVLGALITGITASSEHRALAVEETILKSTAETIKNQVEQQGNFTKCATTSSYSSFLPAATSGYTAPTITAVGNWNGSAFDTNPANCIVATQQGLQLVTISVSTMGVGSTQSLSFVIRDPNYVPAE